MDFFSIHYLLVHIPLGLGGYDLSWIEAIGTIAGLICIGLITREKISNYLFGLINVILFALIFLQIQLYASFLLQIVFFFCNIYGWYAWSRQTVQQDYVLKIRWLPRYGLIVMIVGSVIAILLLSEFIDPVFEGLNRFTFYLLQQLGIELIAPQFKPDAYPFWDATMTVLSVVAMLLMTRKYTENWWLWIMINLISVVIFSLQGVYVMALEYLILTFIAVSGARLWVQKAKRAGYRFFN